MSFFHSINDIRAHIGTSHNARREYTEQVITSLDSLGRALNAVRFVDAEFAVKSAEELGKLSASTLPLYGVPLAHKELFGRKPPGQQGWLFEGGSRSCEGQRATRTAHVISQLDDAGALDCGRLVSVEYALGVTGHNEYAGTPINPWHSDYICGGSSSGTAACVAAGILPASLGSDTGGSIRLPAAACGLVGIKPSHGLVSRAGVFELSASLDTVGPLSRSVRDGALILQAISGYDSADPSSIDTPNIDYTASLGQPVEGLRLALATDYFLSGSDADIADETVSCFEAAEQWGVRLSEIAIPDIANTNPLNILMISTEAAQVHHDRLLNAHELLNEQTVMRIVTGMFSNDAVGRHLGDIRAEIAARLIDLIFDKTDIVITPVWPFTLPTIQQSDVKAKPEAGDLMQRIGHNTRPINFLGLPAIVLPVGRDKNGLPMSIQLVGKPYSEAQLLKLAWHFEQHFSFWDQKPDLSLLSKKII